MLFLQDITQRNFGKLYHKKKTGYINGYERLFNQGSTSHRGTDENPGRVANLVPKENGKVLGSVFRQSSKVQPKDYAYQVQNLNSIIRLSTEQQARQALCHLNHRECELGGYQLVILTFHSDGLQISSVAYVATPENPLYVENETTEVTAQIIGRLFTLCQYGLLYSRLPSLCQNFVVQAIIVSYFRKLIAILIIKLVSY